MKLHEIGIKKIFGRKKIQVKFNKHVEKWERTLKKMIDDQVVLAREEGKKLVEKEGDLIAYEVFHLDEREGICCDLTLLRFGKIPVNKGGELFSTYGHAHNKEFGECYVCLKNDVFLILTDKEKMDTKIIKMGVGDVVFIHPRYMHRLTVKNADSLVLGFVPKEAGHDYDIIKNKGFPYHIFSDGKIEFVCNEKYGVKKLIVKNSKKMKFDVIKTFLKNTEKLKDILHNPKKYKKFYSL
ncbi:MAG: hypothetical protein OH319_03675 [Candidatus Parvarchaeota archaeon]|nr:hypothetical protein [Candidatus Jingweiarchaeum tengchongense]MCW1298580.1 hypothetical protein [Candidatus Jingweiarchaeum tengchongense]MCW1300426.1 hypothetical protein [Candidatus Jingweiarchaeum tengchongense]MCW1304604.1 hypothetical protein [Candidatus Jingweiarchaeum tengchongense]MCW1306086.1 hypothetical protein [Candidatus Jingweiarchaeum tengchongense]